jgi:hypothetical protein
MTRIVDFNISTPRNRIQSRIVIPTALTLARILNRNKKEILCNLRDESGKVIINIENLAIGISNLLNVNLKDVHISYFIPINRCLVRGKIYDIDKIKINDIDFKGNLYGVSLTKVIVV